MLDFENKFKKEAKEFCALHKDKKEAKEFCKLYAQWKKNSGIRKRPEHIHNNLKAELPLPIKFKSTGLPLAVELTARERIKNRIKLVPKLKTQAEYLVKINFASYNLLKTLEDLDKHTPKQKQTEVKPILTISGI